MSVKVKLHPLLQRYTDNQEAIEVTGCSVGECLESLGTRFPGSEQLLFDQEGRLLGYIDIYVNGEGTYPEKLTRSVKDGDEVSITVIMLAGG